MDLVSIGVPIYNGEKYLRESLDSIVNQTYENLEILIIDDQSTDNSISIAKEYQEKDNRIIIIRNEQNLGLVGNWNKCIEESSGLYLKLHFQDDMMSEDTIEKMMLMMKKHDLEVVMTDREYFFEENSLHKKDFYSEGLPRLSDYLDSDAVIKVNLSSQLVKELGIYKNFLGEPILGLVSKKLFSTYGFYDQDLKQTCDFEFWLRLILNTKVGFIAERLHLFRVHDESQGAKNARKKGINPSILDRVNISYKMHTDPIYSMFRSIVGNDFTKKVLQDYVTKYLKSYGKKELSKHLKPSILEYAASYPFWKKVFKSS